MKSVLSFLSCLLTIHLLCSCSLTVDRKNDTSVLYDQTQVVSNETTQPNILPVFDTLINIDIPVIRDDMKSADIKVLVPNIDELYIQYIASDTTSVESFIESGVQVSYEEYIFSAAIIVIDGKREADISEVNSFLSECIEDFLSKQISNVSFSLPDYDELEKMLGDFDE